MLKSFVLIINTSVISMMIFMMNERALPYDRFFSQQAGNISSKNDNFKISFA